MKYSVVLLLLFLISGSVLAQKEVYLTKEKPVVQNIHGFSADIQGSFVVDNTGGYTIGLNYFNELKLAKRISNIFVGGFRGTSNYVNLDIGVEPRYYFNLKERTSADRGGLNSGWFLSLPIDFDMVMLSKNIKFGDSFTSRGELNVGCRYPLTNKWFIEGKAGGGLFKVNKEAHLLSVYSATLKLSYSL
jgi:hypothetical protein